MSESNLSARMFFLILVMVICGRLFVDHESLNLLVKRSHTVLRTMNHPNLDFQLFTLLKSFFTFRFSIKIFESHLVKLDESYHQTIDLVQTQILQSCIEDFWAKESRKCRSSSTCTMWLKNNSFINFQSRRFKFVANDDSFLKILFISNDSK